jgi:hypothetical protein
VIDYKSTPYKYFNQVQKRPIINGDDWRLKFPPFYAAFNTAPHSLPIPADTLLKVA